jgi:hypothetical protein
LTAHAAPGAAPESPPLSPEKAAFIARVFELLGQALEHCQGTHTLADIRREIEAARLNLWIGEDAAAVAVTEFVNYPTGQVLNVFLAAGDHRELNRCLPGLEAYARGRGAVAVMFYGRPPTRDAWQCLLPGFRPAWLCLWKDL